MARSLCGLTYDCRAYVEDITESRKAFAVKQRGRWLSVVKGPRSSPVPARKPTKSPGS